ncbi:MAG TPA: ABC transporter substrate-binding protein [Chloroflexota bacterium]|nr:ABC transporter substrate-binding protein [Chloroflexota bacterium]
MRLSVLGFLITLALGRLVAPLAVAAQPPAKVPRIGYLGTSGSPQSCRSPAFLHALRERGYVDGQTVSVTWRCAEGRTDVARQFAAELVRLEVDVIVASGLAGAHAVKAATPTIPIIFTAVGDPVEGALVPSLTPSSGNLTGVTNIPDHAFFATHLALLREAVPDLTRVALLLYADDPFRAGRIPPVETAARAVGIDLHLVDVTTPDAFEAAVAAMRRQGVGGLLVSFTPFLTTHHAQIAGLAAQYRLPAIAHRRQFAEQGGLMAYGWDQAELWRGVVSYLERILHGTKPADLPVQRPAKYHLVINLKTAQALGLTLPPSLLFQADEVLR